MKMKLFYTLEEAIIFSKSDIEMAIFSKEHGLGGKRHFLVGTREEFWRNYKNQSCKKHYEVILSGIACKLFFDLEFDRLLNDTVNGFIMTKTLICLVIKHMMENYGINICLEDVCVLDSSTEKKFSAHVIFSKCVFFDIETCGQFVNHLIFNLDSKQERSFTIVDQYKQEGIFVDQTVYTKNRNFRLFLSSKFGKNNPLEAQSISHFMEGENRKLCCEKTVFFQSLITNIPKNIELVPWDKKPVIINKIMHDNNIGVSNFSMYPEFDKGRH